MSSHSGSTVPPPLPVPPETVQIRLFTPAVDAEDSIEVRPLNNTLLEVIAKERRIGHTSPLPVIRYLDLTSAAVLPLYATTDNTDVSRRWPIRVISGAEGPFYDAEYELRSEKDALTFQRLVTGYTPCQRFENVSASTLEQHMFRRATETHGIGEVQLWCSQPPEPLDASEPPLPYNGAPTRQGTENRFMAGPESVFSTQSTQSVRSVIQTDQKGRELVVSRAQPPPLLVLLGRGAASDSRSNPYCIWRVNIRNLETRPFPRNANQLQLLNYQTSWSGRTAPFNVHILAVQDVAFWNICHIRLGAYARFFERRSCESLTLSFQCSEDVGRFQASLRQLQHQSRASWRLSSPPSSPPMPSPRPPQDARSMPEARRPSESMAASVLGPRSEPDPGPQIQVTPAPSPGGYMARLPPASTVSEYPQWAGRATPRFQPASQLVGQAGPSQNITNFETVAEEDREGLARRNGGRMPDVGRGPGYPPSITSYGIVEYTYPYPPRPVGPVAPQDGSFRERVDQWREGLSSDYAGSQPDASGRRL